MKPDLNLTPYTKNTSQAYYRSTCENENYKASRKKYPQDLVVGQYFLNKIEKTVPKKSWINWTKERTSHRH